ncbi:MAG: iron ABC transporter permease [Pseudomonadota bacterium]
MAVLEQESPPLRNRAARARLMHVWLALALVITAVISLTVGATGTSLLDVAAKLMSGQALTPAEHAVMFHIRMPRLVMGCLVGAALAVSGVVMQGLFRNPLADPGIVGVSAGAGLGAIFAIVLGGALTSWLATVLSSAGSLEQAMAIDAFFGRLQPSLTPIAAFVGAWVTTLLLYRVATRGGRTSVATMLLAGIALGALSGALTGIMVYLSDDQQLRELTFWGLGSLAGASWVKLAFAAPIIVAALCIAGFLGAALNGLALGEATAHHIGIPVQRMKNIAILAVAAATGAAVAISGGIGFIGIVVPHLLRLATGPDHRPLLINAAILGAILLVVSDMISRVIVAPSELPIGIVTAVLGAPVFLWILLRQRSVVDL